MFQGAMPRRMAGVVRACAVITTAALVGSLAGCGPPAASTSLTAIDQIRSRGELRVVTLNLPTTYYLGAHGPRGIEFELARRFAAELAVTLVMQPVMNEQAMQAELASGRADIAAAQLSDSPDWRAAGEPAKPYNAIPQLVVYNKSHSKPSSVAQFQSAKLAVRAGSPQEAILQQLSKTIPHMRWIETAPSWADPLEDVDDGEADYAITDSREFSFSHQLYPSVDQAFSLPQLRPVQWIVRKGAGDLVQRVNTFFAKLSSTGQLALVLKESTGDSRPFSAAESSEFKVAADTKLPQFRNWFEQASAETGLDWRLLAAVAYQESKWDPKSESPDAARGIMMLMDTTAARLGVKDPHDPQQAIFGGARYLAEMHDRMPDRIPEPDKTWLTIASYNCGPGHVEDARQLAASMGKNPNSWPDVRAALPLLQQERYYQKAHYGYARGWEPAQMVDRVQRFLTLLEWQPGEGLASQSTRVKVPETPPVADEPAPLHKASAARAVKSASF